MQKEPKQGGAAGDQSRSEKGDKGKEKPPKADK